MPGYIIARHSSILSDTGLCQATSSRGTAAFSATPAYAKLHHREAQHHSQQNRPMPSYIIARHSSILSNPGLCQATSSQGAASFSATPAYARLHHREAQQHLHQPRRMPSYVIAKHMYDSGDTRLFTMLPLRCHSGLRYAAPLGTGEQRLPPTLGPVVLPRVPLLVGVDQGEELTHSLLGRLPTTHLLQTLRNPWEPRSAMDLRAGLAQGQSTGLLPRAQAAFWCGKPCLAESHVGI